MAIAALLLSLWAGAAAICEEPNVRYQGVQLSTERGLEDVSACRASCVNTLGCQHFSFTEKKVISMEELMRRKAEAERKAEEEREKEEEKRREEEARRKAEEQAEKEKEMAKEAKEAAAEQAAKEKKMAEEAKEAAAELQAKQEAKKEELEEQAKEKAEQEAQEKELAEATEVTQEQQIEQEATEEEILAKAKEKAREDDLKRTAEANSEDLEVESPEESTEELTEEPDALEAEQPETENIQAKVAAQQEKLKAQLLKMLGTPTEDRQLDLKGTAEASGEDLEVESPEESTKELTQEPETREAKKEKIQAKVAAQQEKLKAQLLKMLGTPTEERRLDGNPIRKLQDQTIAPSVCVLFDSTSQKEPADSEKRITSGSVSCPASEQRPPLGHVELGQIFKEVDRGSQAPGSVFLQRGPRPTNAWWSQTFINKNLGDQSNFLTQMPYIIGADKKGVHVMQPFMTSPGMEEFQHGLGVFFGAEGELTGPYADSWDEACVTLTYRGSNPGQALSFPSCRGSAYVTAELRGLKPSISSDLPLAVPHQIRVDGKPVTCGDQNFVQGKEIEFTLSTGDIWIAFFPAGMGWTCQLQPFRLTAAEIAPAKGVAVRLAMLKGKNSGEDAGWADLVRKHAATYPVTSGVDYAANEEEDVAQVIFDWRNRRTIPGLEECDALQLLWPHQVSLMAEEEKSQVESAPKTPFKDLRGEPKVFVARSPLVLRYPLYPTHEFAGRHPVPPGTLRDMILEALKGGTHMAGSKYNGAKSDSEFELPQNVKLGVGDTYFSGKLLARMARLVAIADELGLSNEAFVNRMLTELADTLGKWLGKGAATPFIYDKSWGGLVSCGCTYDDCWGSCAPKCTNDISQPTTCPALNQVGYNFGNGFYNDHHFHYGYFIYSAAVLAKFRPEWEQQWRPQLLALIRDYANPSSADQMFPLARHKDWFMGFSWAGGIKFEPLGRNQESVSEAINSYYAIACYGTILMKRGGEAKELGVQLRQLGRLFTAMEIHSGDMFWHVRPQAEILSNYPHPTVGIMWEHVALHQTWFGGAGWAVEGIQMLPVIPVLEDFLKKDWVQNHFLQYQDSCENDPSCKHLGWSWLVCIQQAVLSVEDAYDCLRRLDESAFSLRSPAASGNSLTNSLYWFATRDERPDVEPWPVAQAQVITTPQPGSQTPQDFGPIHKFGHHGVRMNNNCFKNNDVACPKVPSIRCIGESCCPDGSLCPSAPFYSSPMCKTPKQVACRGTDGDDPAMKKVQKSKDGHCPVGSVVMCPDGKTSCQQSQCCPDNSLCPSAPASAQGACLKPKAHDCTGLGKKKVVKYKMEKQCQVGERVKCADANVKCWGSMCCPDGAPCPSAAKTTKCWKPKFADCTPPDTTLPPTEKPWFRDFGQERSQSRSHEERDSYGDSYGDSIDSRHSRYSDEEGGDFYGDSSYDSSFDSRRSRYSDEEPSRDFYGSDGSGYSDEEGDSFGEDSYGDSIDSRRSRYSDEEPSRDFYGSSGDSEERSSEFFGGSSNSEDASDSWGDDFGDSFQDRDRMAKDDEASKVSDEAKSSGEAECDESRKCMWGESVLCPDKKSRCAGSGCCPDGSMCPSAPPGATGCSMGKAFDCTCAPKPKIIGHASCLIGASVPCPDDPSTKCSMAGCCPDGSTCPSAPLGTMCPFPKKKDCTGQTIAKYDASIEEFQPNVFRSFNPYASAAIASAMVIAAFTLLVVKGRSASRHYIIVPEGEA